MQQNIFVASLIDGKEVDFLGTFITLEGGDGAGKTSVLEEVAAQLEADGYDILLTREPGGISISEQIREIILNPAHTEMEERTEALLYAAARRQHLVQKIIPALDEGKIVLCDRFIDSSLAYQGYAREIGIDNILKINEFAIEGFMPSLTIYLDIDPKVGLQRINDNIVREKNRLDLETLQFHQKVREGYQLLVEKFPNRVKQIDANREFALVMKDVYRKIISHLEKRELL